VIRIGIGTVGIGIGKGIGKAIGTEVDDPYYRIEAESGGYPPRSGGERNSSYQSNYNGVGYGNPKEEAYPSSRRLARDSSLAGETILSDDGGGGGWRGNSGRHGGRGRATGRPRRDP
jgi:hypothetical protein